MNRFNRWGWMAVLALAASGGWAEGPVVGKNAPAFALSDMNGKKTDLADFRGKTVVLEWVNHGCPFVKKHYQSGNLPSLQKEFTGRGVVWLSICSSAEGKQGHMTREAWKAVYKEKNMASTAVLLDPTGKVGQLYGAKTTPHMFVIDSKGLLVYNGAIDDTPTPDPEDVPGAKNYVRAALENILSGKPVETPSTTPYGCGVKYK